jgi:hypothetical protein
MWTNVSSAGQLWSTGGQGGDLSMSIRGEFQHSNHGSIKTSKLPYRAHALNALLTAYSEYYASTLCECPGLWRNRLEADCGSEGMGFDPHSGQSKVRLFSLSILTDNIVLVVQSCTPPSIGSLVSV